MLALHMPESLHVCIYLHLQIFVRAQSSLLLRGIAYVVK